MRRAVNRGERKRNRSAGGLYRDPILRRVWHSVNRSANENETRVHYRVQEEKTGDKTTEAIVIDALKKPSASKR